MTRLARIMHALSAAEPGSSALTALASQPRIKPQKTQTRCGGR